MSAFDRMPLNSLRVFEAVATALSFSEAAEALNVTPAAVSMQIKSLEDYLQVALFRRNARSIELTAEGVQLLPAVRRALDEIRIAVQRLRADRSAGPLNVSMLASFLQRWFVARLPAFGAANADIDLRIHTSIDNVDFASTDFHAAIRYGRGAWPALHTDKLFDDWLLPVGSPALVRKLGLLKTAQDLSRYNLLHSDSEPWSLWTRGGMDTPNLEGGVALDDSAAILSAVEHGQGLALARWSLVAGDIQAGRLVAASRHCVAHSRAYFFVCPRNYLTLPKVARFRSWLLEEAGRFKPCDLELLPHAGEQT